MKNQCHCWQALLSVFGNLEFLSFTAFDFALGVLVEQACASQYMPPDVFQVFGTQFLS